MKYLRLICILILSGWPFSAAAIEAQDTLFQVQTLDSLMAGDFEGQLDFQTLKTHGDFGIGTFDGLDGEMICLEGRFYQVKSSGIISPVNPTQKTPFAVMTFFTPDQTVAWEKTMTMLEFVKALDALLAPHTGVNFIKLHGNFTELQTRSVPKQTAPYPRLSEVLKHQTVFSFRNISGTLAGFWSPPYLKTISGTGYHFHFISDDLKAGGHVLGFILRQGKMEIDDADRLEVLLPRNGKSLASDAGLPQEP